MAVTATRDRIDLPARQESSNTEGPCATASERIALTEQHRPIAQYADHGRVRAQCRRCRWPAVTARARIAGTGHNSDVTPWGDALDLVERRRAKDRIHGPFGEIDRPIWRCGDSVQTETVPVDTTPKSFHPPRFVGRWTTARRLGPTERRCGQRRPRQANRRQFARRARRPRRRSRPAHPCPQWSR